LSVTSARMGSVITGRAMFLLAGENIRQTFRERSVRIQGTFSLLVRYVRTHGGGHHGQRDVLARWRKHSANIQVELGGRP
jgi:hypothetical protein